MIDNRSQLNSNYNDQGYFVIRNYFNASEISSLRKVILKFHELWKLDNVNFYQKEAFNSSLITGSKYLEFDDRVKLFNFISSKKNNECCRTSDTDYPSFYEYTIIFQSF